MMNKFKSWCRRNFMDDPYEESATVAFGIGCPFALAIFVCLFGWLTHFNCTNIMSTQTSYGIIYLTDLACTS